MADLLAALKEERERLLKELKVVEAHIATKVGSVKKVVSEETKALMRKKAKERWAKVKKKR